MFGRVSRLIEAGYEPQRYSRVIPAIEQVLNEQRQDGHPGVVKTFGAGGGRDGV
jgi:hypothetical protein